MELQGIIFQDYCSAVVYQISLFPLSSMSQILKKIDEEGERLSKPDDCPAGVYRIMQHCWQAKPADRPTFASLKEDLTTVSRKFCKRSEDFTEKFRYVRSSILETLVSGAVPQRSFLHDRLPAKQLHTL